MFRLYKTFNFCPWNSPVFGIACSGGYDSMAVADFFVKGRRKPVLIHINHSTGNDAAQSIVENYAKQHDLKCFIHTIDTFEKRKDQSWEEFWREQRMNVFFSFGMPIITGHNLDDAMETWLFSSIHGTPKLIPYNTNNLYRPFILTRKEELKNYVIKNKIAWAEDQSNIDVKYARNRIRHNIMPEVMKINEGFDSVIRKKYISLGENHDTL
jgi:tRNA(Ile)-lysidine synthase